ncbi:relaxase/mobilization nuclease domain-containing protein [Streptomyces sp. NPDC047049]|uniref:relaxase/mobilization nuclease domain-containing protein n=1 Tax=Streptomyces sp. NPDC047049 TaxID=3156688 RepID=UPI0033C3D53E
MIAKAADRGSRSAGLLYYLYGPGKANEHEDPHLVAAWSEWVPDPGRSETMTIAQLAGLLDQPVHALEADGGKPWKKYVYHIPVSNEPGDPTLTDAQWKEVAQRIVEASGIVDPNEPGGCRWVAVRHADNHIHIVATLVRQDGRKPEIHNDGLRFRPVCNEFEKRWGLKPTAPADRTGHRRPKRGETEKATRKGLPEAPRETLRREAYTAAAKASNPAEFFAALRDAGLIVEARTGQDGEPTGYKVGRPEWRTKEGNLIWYSGSGLAPDLSLPQLKQRWASIEPTAGLSRVEVLNRAAAVTTRATDMVVRAARENPARTPEVVSAAAELMTANARALEGRRGGPLTDAAEAFRRAARVPNRQPVRRDETADAMRLYAHTIAQAGRLLGAGEKDGARQLAAQLTLLVDAVAVLREAQEARHQAEAALAAARFARQHPGQPLPPQLSRAAADTTGTTMRIMGRDVEVRADAAGREDLMQTVRRGMGSRAEEVLGDPAWPALATTLAKVEEAGRDPLVTLRSARAERELDTAESVAQVMVWRLENRLDTWQQEGTNIAPQSPQQQPTQAARRPQQPGPTHGRGRGPRV